MKTKEEIRDWILDNCIDINGIVNLRGLDFGSRYVNLTGLMADTINNTYQKAFFSIDNEGQESDDIYNNKQVGREIYNDEQRATAYIFNRYQESNRITNKNQEAKKIIT